MPQWPEEEIVLVSAIEHFSYCPRQCALIHVEKVFDENVFTLRGRRAHERVDEPEFADEQGKRMERALPIWCHRLGLQGKADLVEFWVDGTVYPVEYKYGGRRAKVHDDLQLCAQALCLEEMLNQPVSNGALFYYSSRRRREVTFDDRLRAHTERVIREIRGMLAQDGLPPPADDARCPKCSLVDICMPGAIAEMSHTSVHPRLYTPAPEEELA